MARTKKRKVQIKRQKVWLGWANRIYIDGTYMGPARVGSAKHHRRRPSQLSRKTEDNLPEDQQR